MRSGLWVIFVVVSCGGISRRTVEDADGGGGGVGGTSGSGAGGSGAGGSGAGGSGTSGTSGSDAGGSISLGGTTSTLPDPCGIGWLDVGQTCPSGEISYLDDPVCNQVLRCLIGSACVTTGNDCAACLAGLESELSIGQSVCLPASALPQLPAICAALGSDQNSPFPECTPDER